eukprot:6040292-Pyramimonas_sp.AAC.1
MEAHEAEVRNSTNDNNKKLIRVTKRSAAPSPEAGRTNRILRSRGPNAEIYESKRALADRTDRDPSFRIEDSTGYGAPEPLDLLRKDVEALIRRTA